MKLKNLFWFATGASISYHLVKNRKEIKTEVTESSQLVKGIQDNLAKIQRNLDIIQDQKTNRFYLVARYLEFLLERLLLVDETVWSCIGNPLPILEDWSFGLG